MTLQKLDRPDEAPPHDEHQRGEGKGGGNAE
jgi:hypothetical protein